MRRPSLRASCRYCSTRNARRITSAKVVFRSAAIVRNLSAVSAERLSVVLTAVRRDWDRAVRVVDIIASCCGPREDRTRAPWNIYLIYGFDLSSICLTYVILPSSDVLTSVIRELREGLHRASPALPGQASRADPGICVSLVPRRIGAGVEVVRSVREGGAGAPDHDTHARHRTGDYSRSLLLGPLHRISSTLRSLLAGIGGLSAVLGHLRRRVRRRLLGSPVVSIGSGREADGVSGT